MTIFATDFRGGAGSASIGSAVIGGLPTGILFVDPSGDLATNSGITYDPVANKVSISGILDPVAYLGTVQTIAQRDALVATSPLTKAGYLVYVDTGSMKQYQVWDGTAWSPIGGTVTIDATPTDGSSNAVSSDGVFDALALKVDKSTLSAKGSLVSASAAATPAELATGTDGQILAVNSATATGLEWITPAAGAGPASETVSGTVELADATETEAGTDGTRAISPLRAEAVYVKKSAFNAKGDLLSATADNTPVVVTVGTDGQVLMADSAEASGVRWATPAADPAATTAVIGNVEIADTLETEAGTGTPDNAGATLVPSIAATEATYLKKSTIDAKGDLLVGTADNTIARLAVGTDGQVLAADSAEATGAKWITIPDEVVENAGVLSGAAPAGAQFGINTATGTLFYVSGGNWTAVPVSTVDLNTTVASVAGNGTGLTVPTSPPATPDIADLHVEIYDDVTLYFTAVANDWLAPVVVEVARDLTAFADATLASIDGVGAGGVLGTAARSDHRHAAQGVSSDALNRITIGTDGLHYLANASATEISTGFVELATSAETLAGIDNSRAVHPVGLKAALDLKQNVIITDTDSDNPLGYVVKHVAGARQLTHPDSMKVVPLVAAPVDGVTVAYFIGQLFWDYTNKKLYEATAKSTDPDAAAAGSTFAEISLSSVVNRVFADNTGVAPAQAGQPSEAEIKAWNDAQATPQREGIIFFTGTDVSTDAKQFVWWVDAAGDVDLIWSKAAVPSIYDFVVADWVVNPPVVMGQTTLTSLSSQFNAQITERFQPFSATVSGEPALLDIGLASATSLQNARVRVYQGNGIAGTVLAEFNIAVSGPSAIYNVAIPPGTLSFVSGNVYTVGVVRTGATTGTLTVQSTFQDIWPGFSSSLGDDLLFGFTFGGGSSTLTIPAALHGLGPGEKTVTLFDAGSVEVTPTSVSTDVPTGDITITNPTAFDGSALIVTGTAATDEVIESAGALAGASPTGAKWGIDTTTGQTYYVSGGNWTASIGVSPFQQDFVSGDWSAPSGGYRTLAIAAGTHGKGASPGMVQVFEDDGTNLDFVGIDRVRVVKASGDVELRVVDGSEFTGRVVIG